MQFFLRVGVNWDSQDLIQKKNQPFRIYVVPAIVLKVAVYDENRDKTNAVLMLIRWWEIIQKGTQTLWDMFSKRMACWGGQRLNVYSGRQRVILLIILKSTLFRKDFFQKISLVVNITFPPNCVNTVVNVDTSLVLMEGRAYFFSWSKIYLSLSVTEVSGLGQNTHVFCVCLVVVVFFCTK